MKFKIQRSWIVVSVALVLGLGAGLLAMRYLNTRVEEIEARNKQTMMKVVVAKADLTKGTALSPDNVAVREVPVEWAHSGSITPDQYDRADNSVLAYPAAHGEAILWSQLEGQKTPSFSARLSAGRRAVTVPVDEVNSLSGMLEPGDTIDLLVTVAKDNKNYTYPILQSIQVLATGTKVTPQPNDPQGRGISFTTVTLDTSPEDAKRIVAAREVGKITALLRAPGDIAEVSGKKSDAFVLLGLAAEGSPHRSGGAIPVIYGGQGFGHAATPPININLSQLAKAATPAQ